MRIGLDIGSLAHDRVVERAILVTADTDMIPAMKLGRRIAWPTL
ncbi:MAG: NYN domain-containing protein [Alphaproteobacteria bacterium]|nr:NYN domain-containing protein [Alphaproteobacteria bacterium]